MMLDDFRTFVMRGNVVDLAVGVIIGAAFGAITKSLVDDVIMPPIGLLLGGLDFTNMYVVLKEGANAAGPYATLAEAKEAGAVTLNYGLFITSIVTFVIIAFAVYLLVKTVNRMHRPAAAPATTKDCPECAMAIPLLARKCPHCTTVL
ncbi:MAG TPA: large-conductance mechanosensitive channel protein MscL [Gemmatimonadales bacterium]|nr:large-conductance mechanosensitive channel protein MscL [Gemmatimonadales bacterium]